MKDFIKDNMEGISIVVVVALIAIHPAMLLIFPIVILPFIIYKNRYNFLTHNKSKPKPANTDIFINKIYMSNKEKVDYLKSDRWKILKHLTHERDNFKCVTCGSSKYLNCHHITYERLGEENIEDLITLCSNCHSELHKNLGYDRKTTYNPISVNR